MNGFAVVGNDTSGFEILDRLSTPDAGRFVFSLVISYTETCEIPGITIAGEHPDLLKYTPSADAEYINYGFCKSLNSIPMTPDGKPTPAIVTKTCLEQASIPSLVVNAGSKVTPQLPYVELGLKHGKRIDTQSAMDYETATKAFEYGRLLGRTLAASTDCLVIGESIPGGTTTSLAVLTALGIDEPSVSSSMIDNPLALKKDTVNTAIKRLTSKDVLHIVSEVGDPTIPTIAGMLNTASESTVVLLAGGTQMAAVLAVAKEFGFNQKNTAIATTKYITNDLSAKFVSTVEKIANIPVFVSDLGFENSNFDGLRSYANGFIKEGAGAGGASISCMLKARMSSDRLRVLIEREYSRLISQ